MASFSLADLEIFLLIAVRISGFILTAPVFSQKQLPVRVKILLSIAFSIICFTTVPRVPVEYTGILEYTIIILKESVAGMILGLFCTLAYNVIAMAGQMMDMEIGLSNIQEFDPSSNQSFTVSSTLFGYAVTLMLIVTDMHLFILKAVIDSFELIPIGSVNISGNIYEIALKFIVDYMIIAFRIVLPVFAAILIVNTILAILAKVAPQMNMFVIGFQLKIVIGLSILIIMMMYLNSISDMVFNKMIEYMRRAIPYMGGGV